MPQRTSELAVLASPFALVLVLNLFARIEPQSSLAQPRIFDTPSESLTSQGNYDAELVQWIASLNINPEMRSPMSHGPRPEVQVIAPVYKPPTSVSVYENPLKNAKLTSVIGTGDRALASINGHLYRMSDEPAAGCYITLIDATRQIVGVTLPTGEVYLIRAQRP